MRYSIITPNYNRPDRLKEFLESLADLDYPKAEFEAVIVDDGSDAPTEETAEGFREVLQIRFLRQNHGGVAKARHRGAYAARGRYLVFTDDDCKPRRDWLRAFDVALEQNPGAAFGGLTVNGLGENPWSTASQAIIHFLYESMNGEGRATFFTGNNCLFPREGYFAIGGLDTTWPMCGEDRDLCARWTESGRDLIYVPAAVVEHFHVLDGERFWRQHYNYGRGARRYRVARAKRGAGEIRLERRGFYAGLIGAAWRHGQGHAGWLIALMILFAQAANAMGYLDEMVSPLKDAPRWAIETGNCA